jgi:uncharacterized membrane protein
MSVVVVPCPWPAPVVGCAGAPVAPPDAAAARWVMRRNCSMSPRQLGGVFLSLCLLSAAIALGFWWAGATAVVWFTGLELLALAAALLVHARHATDRELVAVEDGRVRVELRIGAHLERHSLDAALVRVRLAGGLVELAAGGQAVRVGRHLRPHRHAGLAREIQMALRGGQRQHAAPPGAAPTTGMQST